MASLQNLHGFHGSTAISCSNRINKSIKLHWTTPMLRCSWSYWRLKLVSSPRHEPGLFVGCWGTYLLQTTESSDAAVDMQDDPVLALQKHLAGERNFEPQSSTFRWKNHQSWWFDKDSKASLKVWWNQDLAQWYQSFSSWNWYLFEYCPDHIPFFIPMMYSQYKGIRIHIIYLYIYIILYQISYIICQNSHMIYRIPSNISYIIEYIIYSNNIYHIFQ